MRTAIGGRPSPSRRRLSVAIAETMRESRLDGATRVRLIGDRIAVVGQDAVAEILGDVALARLDLPGGDRLVCPNDISQVLRIEALRQGRRVGHVAEQHRHLATLSLSWR